MNDDWIAPDHRRAVPTPSARAEEVWRLYKGGRVLSCALRDESASGAGWEVLVLEDGRLRFSRLFRDEPRARIGIHALKRGGLKGGWTEHEIEKGGA